MSGCSNECSQHSECVNGACKCTSGYVANEYGYCEGTVKKIKTLKKITSNFKINLDIDECRVGVAICKANSVCRNTVGSYLCDCLDGYIWNGTLCEQQYIEKIGDLRGFVFIFISTYNLNFKL